MITMNSGLYDRIDFELERIKKESKSCIKTLAKMPPENLITLKKDNHYEYYFRIGKKQKYLNISQIKTIETLATKKYLKNFIRYAQNEIKALEAYKKVKDLSIPTPSQFLSMHPELSTFLNKKIFKGSKDIVEWATSEYNQNDYYPDGLKIRSAQGHLVRSKSECIIADALFSEGITYRYEEAININGITYHPDFKIIKANGEIIIWEHLGMMDIEEYTLKNIQKIADYIKAGYIPGVNLILTSDEKSGQIIDSFKVHKLIEAYLTF